MNRWPSIGRPRSLRAKLALSLAAVLLSGGTFVGTLAAFAATTSNTANTFTTGTVLLSDNDAGSAMLSLSGAKPGDASTACIRVTYAGTLPATVRPYGTTTGSGLDAYLTLTVTRGAITSPTFPSCTGFTADATNYLGAGAGIVYSGTLQAYADDYASAVPDPTAAATHTWVQNETHDYKFSITVVDNNVAQGKNATQTFTWEARNT